MDVEILTTLGVGATILASIVPAILYLAGRIDETNKIIVEQGQALHQRIDETNRIIVEQGQALHQRIDETNKIIVGQGRELNQRIDVTNNRIDGTNQRIDEQINQQTAFREDITCRIGKVEGMLGGQHENAVKERAA